MAAEPFMEGPLITPLPGPKTALDVSQHPDLDGPDTAANRFNNGYAEDTADDDTSPGSRNRDSIG